ncbi:MAG: TIGR00282 family metallophosphoesterase [Dehalococcoidales bacterium]|nr:MAG: TIGR00282 family metallophosphoesterase [Dehalococcoidales bacterium]
MIILVIGDIIGRPGRQAVKEILPGLRDRFGIETVIANIENTAGGIGATPSTVDELLACGIDVMTSGNHIWAHKEIIPYLENDKPVIRPLNYPEGVRGKGYIIKKNVAVINLIGRTFMSNYDCPFRTTDKLLEELGDKPLIKIIDFHAEATSEKVALGRYFDGRVSAVLGTHTHIGTIDAGILPEGTAYVTDIGMTGPKDSVIGDSIDDVVQRFLTMIPRRLPVAKGSVIFTAMLMDIENKTGKAKSIERIYQEIEGED